MSWRRQKGHMLEADTEAERDRVLYSFTQANQDKALIFGMDTRTPEGQEAFRKEYEAMAEMAPEIIKKEDLVFPHEMPAQLSDEPHFRRVWQHYRDHSFKVRFAEAVDAGEISEEDAQKFIEFVGMANHPTFSLFILVKSGRLAHLERDEGYQATCRVLDTLGLGSVAFTQTTSMPAEEQFWQQFDGTFELTEADMRKELPLFINDPSNLAKVEALIQAGEQPQLAQKEETRQLSA